MAKLASIKEEDEKSTERFGFFATDSTFNDVGAEIIKAKHSLYSHR